VTDPFTVIIYHSFYIISKLDALIIVVDNVVWFTYLDSILMCDGDVEAARSYHFSNMGPIITFL